MSTSAGLPDVEAVIVARGSDGLLEAAIASLEGQVAPGRVIVVDAAGTEGSGPVAVELASQVRVIAAPSGNLAAANNAGITATSGEFVLLLSPDAALEDRSLRSLVARMHSNRTAAIVAPKLVDPEGGVVEGSFGQFPTLGRAVVGIMNRFAHRISGGRLRPVHDIAVTTPVDWASGTCMLVRRSAIHKAGAMDEGFSLRFYDVEWCHRMADNGFTVLIEPQACCVQSRDTSNEAETPAAQKAYRDAFFRYCKLYRQRGLALLGRVGFDPGRLMGGRG